MPRLLQILCFALSLMTAGLPPGAQTHVPSNRVFNVKDFGASGRKEDNAQGAIQKAIDACAQAGGGMVYVPPGSYTSGTIHLRSHVPCMWNQAPRSSPAKTKTLLTKRRCSTVKVSKTSPSKDAATSTARPNMNGG